MFLTRKGFEPMTKFFFQKIQKNADVFKLEETGDCFRVTYLFYQICRNYKLWPVINAPAPLDS